VIVEVIPLISFFLLFASAIITVEVLTRKDSLKAETSRKLVHVSGGFGALLFPFFIESWHTVAALTSFFIVTLYVGERKNILTCLTNVGRKSIGAIIFPVAILLLFIVANGNTALYVSSLLVLTLADTGAALVGTNYGKIRYHTGKEEMKSVEGSVTFWMIGFLAVHIPLLLLSDIPRETTVLVGILMATLLSYIEAISVRGTDNLFVPIATGYLLLKLVDKPWEELLFQIVSLIFISIAMLIINNRKQMMETRPLFFFILISFACWSLGSSEWILPGIAGIITHAILFRTVDPLIDDFSVQKLFWPFFPNMLILFIANISMNHNFWFSPFVMVTITASSLYLCDRVIDHYKADITVKQGALITISPVLFTILLLLPFEGVRLFSYLFPAMLLNGLSISGYGVLNESQKHLLLPFLATLAGTVIVLLQMNDLVPLLEPFTWKEVFR